jgi:hypothetical protein
MSWSYSGDPSTSEKDAVRFYISDTDQELPLLQDEDIKFLLDRWMPIYKSVLLTSAVACEIIAGKFARQVSVNADGVSVGISELQSKYDQLASSLRDQYKMEQQGVPLLPGVMYDPVWDPTIKPTRFGIGFTDNYLAGRQDYGDYDPSGYPNEWAGEGGAEVLDAWERAALEKAKAASDE